MNNAISTAIPNLDDAMFGGLVKGEVTMIAGTAMSGKSQTLIKLCANLADQGKSVVYITLEETAEKVAASIRFIKLNTSTKQLNKLIYIKEMPMGVNVEEIKAFVKDYEITAKRIIDVIIIDGVDLLKSSVTSKRVPDYMKYDPTTELKKYALAYNRICVGTTQLSRPSSNSIQDYDKLLGKIKSADHILVIAEDRKLHYIHGKGKVGSIIDLEITA